MRDAVTLWSRLLLLVICLASGATPTIAQEPPARTSTTEAGTVTLTPDEAREQTRINLDYLRCVDELREADRLVQLEHDAKAAALRAVEELRAAERAQAARADLERGRVEACQEELRQERRRSRWGRIKTGLVAAGVGLLLGFAVAASQ